MAMSQAEFNRINALERKITELEARIWQLEQVKTIEPRKPGRPKRAEQRADTRSG